MKTSNWVILGTIILWGWIALYAGLYEMSLNCFLAAAIIFTFKNNK